MISPEYCLMMARYNAWQNRLLRGALERMTEAALRQERGAFFGSILGTINHVLWADALWLARLEGRAIETVSIVESPELYETLSGWSTERFRTDGHLLRWAERLGEGALGEDVLDGDLHWYSAAAEKEMTRSRAQCVVHMFNHQTHHRGQVHAMLTQAGENTADTDLPLMPQEGPWL